MKSGGPKGPPNDNDNDNDDDDDDDDDDDSKIMMMANDKSGPNIIYLLPRHIVIKFITLSN